MISNPALMTLMKIVFLSWDYTREYDLNFIRRKTMEQWLWVTTLLACLIAGYLGNLTTSHQMNFMPCQDQIISVGAWIWYQDCQPELLIFAFVHNISIFLQELWEWSICNDIFCAYLPMHRVIFQTRKLREKIGALWWSFCKYLERFVQITCPFLEWRLTYLLTII